MGTESSPSRPTRVPISARLGLLLGLLLASPGARGDAAQQFQEANRLYELGRYEDAASAYGTLLTNRLVSPSLLFNYGNALFKAGRTGEAIASYRAAEQLAPRNPDIRANLSFARRSVPGSASVPTAWWQRAATSLSLDEWTLATSALLWGFCLTWSFTQWRPSKAPLLRWPRRALAISLALCFVGLAASLSARELNRTAVVIRPEVAVRYGPLEDSRPAYTARNGAELAVLGVKGDWCQVSDAARRIGWVRSQDVAITPAK